MTTVSFPTGRRGKLASSVIDQVKSRISSGECRPGERLPSVRALARQLEISCFTAAEAYERLVASGCVLARPGIGYYVARNDEAFQESQCAASDERLVSEMDATPLPYDWHSEKWLCAIRRKLDNLPSDHDVLGLRALRVSLSGRLARGGIDVPPAQMALLSSDVQAVDLALRCFVRSGDVVLIEDPCAAYLFPLLKQHGCRVVTVPRTASGLDIDCMRRLAAQLRPRLAIITTVFHNPLGTTLSRSQAHAVLQIAEEFDFLILEDDAYRHLARVSDPSLTAMDGLKRVVRLGSSSKILPPFAQIASLSASPEIIGQLRELMRIFGLNNSELHQRFLLNAFLSSHFRRHMSQLRRRLGVETARAMELFSELGLVPLAPPSGGIYISARVPNTRLSGEEIERLAQARNVALTPAHRFTSSPCPDVWLRFNVTTIRHPALRDFLMEINRSPAAAMRCGPSKAV